MNPLAGSAWSVVGGVERPDGAAVTVAFADDVVSGSAGCNAYRAGYEIWADRLRIPGPIATTARACPPPLAELEREVLARLERVAGFVLDRDTLAVFDERGRVLFELRRQGVGDLLGWWRVVSLHRPGRRAVAAAEGVLTLELAEGEVRGHGGGNAFRGPWRAAGGGTVAIGPLATTRQRGTDEVMAQEHDLLRALETAAAFRLAGDRLDLLRADGTTAVTLRREEPAG